MNKSVRPARIGQWYLRWDKNAIFRVSGYDPRTRRIQIEGYDGGSEEITEDAWARLPLGLADPPDDWMAEAEVVDVIDCDASPSLPGAPASQSIPPASTSEYASAEPAPVDSAEES